MVKKQPCPHCGKLFHPNGINPHKAHCVKNPKRKATHNPSAARPSLEQVIAMLKIKRDHLSETIEMLEKL